MKWSFGKKYGIKRSFVICVAAACLVQGRNKVLSLGIHYQRTR